MRHIGPLGRESDSPPPPQSDRAPRPLVFLIFSLSPEGFHLLEGGVFGFPSLGFKARLDSSEEVDEFGVRGAKRVFRVELELAGESGRRDEEIAELVRNLRGFW